MTEKKTMELLEPRLDLFDGEAVDSAAVDDTERAPAGKEAGGQQSDVLTENGDGGQQSAAGSDSARREAFLKLANGEYKDVYDEQVQQLVTRRLKSERGRGDRLQQRVDQYQPVIDELMVRYNIAPGDIAGLSKAIDDDASYWERAAEEAGMEPAQFRQFKQMERQNQQLLRAEENRRQREFAEQSLRKWTAEALEAQKTYPELDLQTEARDPQFVSLLRAGIPVQMAYEVMHMDGIKQNVRAQTAKETEKQVTDQIRARGSRPPEGGAGTQSGFMLADGTANMSKQERAAIAERILRGETI